MNERKYVTLLCADLLRSTDLIEGLDPEDAIALLEPSLAAMRSAVRQFRGIVSKELGDGIVALFGAPIADDGHAVMACHAALDLVRRIEQLDAPKTQVRVGLHSAYVVTHTINGDYSTIYEAGGPAAHLVNRIEQTAEPGQIYASESCRTLADGYLSFAPLPTKRLKGFSDPIMLYRLIGVSGKRRWHVRTARGMSAFVNRESERAVLNRAAQDALAGKGQIVSIVGEPGVGKSRLVHEFIDTMEQDGWCIAEAEATPTSAAIPYAMIQAVILSLLQEKPSNNTTSTHPQQKIVRDLPSLWRTAINVVLGQPVEDAAWNELDPASRKQAIVNGCRTLLERITADKQTVILLEDLHWIDDASEAVIEAVGASADRNRVLILLTSRVDYLPRWLGGKRVVLLPLKPLDNSAARTLLDGLLGLSRDLEEIKSRVLRHTGRIPLFIEEVTRRLTETGVVTGPPGDFMLGNPVDQLGIPPTVQGVIAARIDRLPKREKALLQATAGIGIRADVPLMSAITNLASNEMRDALRLLSAAGLLIEIAQAPKLTYEFPHDLVRDVAYESVLRIERKQLHERILWAFETSAERQSDDASELLTHHAVRAASWTKAANYAHLAAQRCVVRSATADAIRYFEVAIDAVDRLPSSLERETRAIDLRLESRRAFAAFGKLQRWLELSAEAERRAIAIADNTRALAAAAVRAAAMNFYYPPTEAIAAGELAVQRAEQLAAVDWLSYTEYGLGQAYQTAGHFRRAEECLTRALERLSLPGANVPFGSTLGLSLLCHMMKGIAHASMGEVDEARACEDRANELAAESQQPYDAIAAGYGIGFYQLRWDDPDKAHTTLQKTLDLARRHEVKHFVPIVACQLAKSHLMKDDAARALDILLDAKREAESLGYTFGVLRASTYLSFAYLQLGDTSRALTVAQTARMTAEQQGFDSFYAEALLAEAAALTADPDVNPARPKECLTSLTEIAIKIEARPQLAAGKNLLGEILMREGDDATSEREFAEAEAILAKMKLTRRPDPIYYV